MQTTTRRRLAALAILALLPLAAPASQLDIAGIKHAPAIELRGSGLQLNGAGVRHKALARVYTVGLYLGVKASTPEEALAAPGVKRVAITMLRDIDAAELGKLLTRGVEDNWPRGELAPLVPGLLRMGQVFAEQKQLKTGDALSLDWVPGTGTVIAIRGVPQGEPIKEQAFYNALLRIWLGPVPADWRLKEALLGRG